MEDELITIGELAKRMNVTVRTLQYYDKEGLLSPSALSQGGRRLYSAKDMLKLHQILSFKFLGFSLEEIKAHIFSMDTPKQVAELLERQEKAIREQIDSLEEALQAVDVLHKEVIRIDQVDFKKYAEIIELLRQGNSYYWVWKCFDDKLAEHVKKRFGSEPKDGERILATYMELLDKMLILKQKNLPPDSPECKEIAAQWWKMIEEFTGGDISLIPELIKYNQTKSGWEKEIADKQQKVDDYLEKILGCYLMGKGISLPGEE